MESEGISTSIKQYSFKEFRDKWNHMKWEIYKCDYNQFAHSSLSLNNEIKTVFGYNDSICTSRGDFAVYSEGEPITINILDTSCVSISIKRKGVELYELSIDSYDKELSGLEYGSYEVSAIDKYGGHSSPVHFEVVDTGVKVIKEMSCLHVFYESHYARPIYITICDERGNKYLIKELSEVDIKDGGTLVPFPQNVNKFYCKVAFATDFGTATNSPILIEL